MSDKAVDETRFSLKNIVVDLSKDNLLVSRIKGVYGAERYKIIRDYILDALGNEPIQLSDGKIVIVDKRDALHIANKALDDKAAHIGKIKELVKKAALYAEYPNAEHNKFDYFYYYKIDVRYGSKIYPIYLNVGRGKTDAKYHLYDITKKIRDTAGRINGLERPKPNEGYALKNDVSNNRIAQDEKGVKQKLSTKPNNPIREEVSDYIGSSAHVQSVIKTIDKRYRLAGKKKLNEKSIQSFANKILSQTNSKYSKEQLTERLTAFFEFMANSRDFSWDDS